MIKLFFLYSLGDGWTSSERERETGGGSLEPASLDGGGEEDERGRKEGRGCMHEGGERIALVTAEELSRLAPPV